MTAGSVAVPRIIPIRLPAQGRSKHQIDTRTRVEIKSDSVAVQIFYTLDGSKPQVVQRGSTLRYRGPVLLPEGRVHLRALALSSDGRQSATVTKFFLVSANESNSENVEEKKHHGGPAAQPRPPDPDAPLPLAVPRFLTHRLGPQTPSSERSPFRPAHKLENHLKQMNITQKSRVQRETDFMRCTQCFSCRPSDPFSGFCVGCGAALPVASAPPQRLAPAEEERQMALCVFCKSLVPANAPSCLICDTAMVPQLQASPTLQNRLLCLCCGSGNPTHVVHCVSCESRLLHSAVGPPPPGQDNMAACSRCKRLNSSDGGYCSWCGVKSGSVSVSFAVCCRCGASCPAHASYCSVCGVFLSTPPAGAATPRDQGSPPAPGAASAPPTEERHTQTDGLFFPSAAHMHRRLQQRALEQSRQQQGRERRPPLTAVSPGRGFWRKQLDHVCTHLRSFAQNQPDFRALVGEPRMGRMVSAVVQDDGSEVSLRINFTSAGEKNEGNGEGRREGTSPKQNLSSVTEEQSSSMELQGPVARRRRRRSLQDHEGPVMKDIQLLQELGPLGRGNIALVQNLLEEGAHPSCRDEDGCHALLVAVLNGHHEVIPLLLQRGADVNQQSGPKKNSALHEAAERGSDGLQAAHTLLGWRASVSRRNARGVTPYDLALSCGCAPMVQLLAARMGDRVLDKLLRPAA